LHSSQDARPFLVSVDFARATISVHGELDRRNAPVLREAFSALTGAPQKLWTLDAAGIIFCDVTGLRALADGGALARSHGRELRFLRPSPFLHLVLTLAGEETPVGAPASFAGSPAAQDADPVLMPGCWPVSRPGEWGPALVLGDLGRDHVAGSRPHGTPEA
jgi:anti-anti-sigma regulatory factor